MVKVCEPAYVPEAREITGVAAAGGLVAPPPAQACGATAKKINKNAKKTDRRKETLGFIDTVVPLSRLNHAPANFLEKEKFTTSQKSFGTRFF